MQAVTNGVVMESPIASMQSTEERFHVVLCIGDDWSDENIFEKILSSMASMWSHYLVCSVLCFCCIG